jgi:hypothetical protein
MSVVDVMKLKRNILFPHRHTLSYFSDKSVFSAKVGLNHEECHLLACGAV